MKAITILEVEYAAHILARELMEWNEPIPDFASRYPSALESCLRAPFQKFGGAYLYKGLLGKAAILFYLMIKNHPFQNGNKRIAMTTLFCFLHQNRKWIEISNQELYNFAKWVAESPPKLKKETVEAVEKFIKSYLVDLEFSFKPLED